MQLAIFNGSPRGKKSNTALLLKHFREGFTENGGEVVSYDYLIQEKKLAEQVEHFKQAQTVFIAFPLYVDSMPGIVKKFIEEIGKYDGRGKKILFLVQSGFPEAVHSEGVKKYLQFLTKRWNTECLGIIIKPGVEGIQIMPGSMTKKLFGKMKIFGSQLIKEGKLKEQDLQKMAKPYKFSKGRLLVFRLMRKIGLANFYWNKNLKEHGAYQKRFDAPYLEKRGLTGNNHF